MKKHKIYLSIIFSFIGILNTYAQRPEKNVSIELKLESKYIQIRDTKIHYVEQGTGNPVLFLHGIPTNLYLWRNVIPEVSISNRAIAVDLVGYGKSDVPASGGYDANNQYSYLEGFIEKMGLKNITLVVNDLGSVYGLKYAADHPENIKGIVVTEGVVMPAYEWRNQLKPMQKMMFTMFRNDGIAKMMLVKKARIQKMIVPMMTKRHIKKVEKKAYTEPYTDLEKRKLVFQGPGPVNFPRKQKLKPETATNEFIKMMNYNAAKLKGTKIPILILYAKPGFILNKKAREYAQANYPNLTMQYLGKGKHFLPEDHPKAIGQFINTWMKK